MTTPRGYRGAPSALNIAEATPAATTWNEVRTEVLGATCECGRSPRSPREQWTFTGRGYTYLVWTRDDGKRWVRWVE